MARMIDADEFIDYLGLNEENTREENLGEIVTLEDFDRQPTVEVEPARYGEWVEIAETITLDTVYMCSECGEKFVFKQNLYKYCPNCGAKMK